MTRLPLRGARRALAFAALIAAGRASAQPTELAFGPATATFARDFMLVGSVRELPDGSLLVADPTQIALLLLDPRTGQATPIGSSGQAAGQYQTVRAGLIGARGDTTLLYDGAAPTLLAITGHSVAARPGVRQARLDSVGVITIAGGDTLGHLLLVLRAPFPLSGGVAPGLGIVSTRVPQIIALSDAGMARIDTVESLRVATAMAWIDGCTPAGSICRGIPLMDVGDQAHLFDDGWIAVAHPEPYHVEWRSPDGARVIGPTLPAVSVPVGEDAKQAAWRAIATQSGGRWPPYGDQGYVWPGVFPAFLGGQVPQAASLPTFGGLFAAPDGRLVIARTRQGPSAESVRYDLIDRSGTLSGYITMPSNERIVGFGASAAYVTVADSSGMEHLQRRPWPPREVPPEVFVPEPEPPVPSEPDPDAAP